MPLCPHHFIRPRLNGLPSTQCRNPGFWPWSLRTSTRYGLQYMSTHAGPTPASAAVESDLAHRPASQSANSHDSSQFPPWRFARRERKVWRPWHRAKARIPISLEDQNSSTPPQRHPAPGAQTSPEDQNSTTPSQRQPASSRTHVTPLLSSRMVRRIMQRLGHNLRFAPSVLGRLNTEISSQDRFINKWALSLAVVIRSNSLYSRELGARQWKAAYEAIYKAKHYQRDVVNKRVLPALKEEGQEMLKKIQDDCHGSFREAWQAMPRWEKAMLWQRLAIWLLQNDPKMCLEFLIVTTGTLEKPDFTMVADCLLYLDNFYYTDWLKDWQSKGHTYESLLEACLNPVDWPIISLPQRGVRLYVRRASPEAVAKALQLMKKRSIQMSAETALCFMWRFTALGDVDLALEALRRIPAVKDPLFTMESEGVMRHCCKLLTLDSVQDGDNGRNFRILPKLLEMGVRPDRDMMNIVLSNAFKTGNPQLAANMLHFMKTHNHDFDSYTYLTLLTDAVTRGDRGRTENLIHEVDAKEEIRKNPYIASKIFHYHYIFTVKQMNPEADPSSVFYSMLDLYTTIHDITPLKQLLIVPPHYTPREEGENIAPSPVALYLILATFFRCQHRLGTVQRIYTRFRELVLQGHPTIAPLAETDHAYNEFLIALRHTPRGLGPCVRVVEDMFHTGPLPKDSEGKTITHVKPSIRTWTLLLSAFLYNGQMLGAEKIKQMMAKHQVQYNDVTWNTIINGYANSQNIHEVAASIKAMEAAGFHLDSYTMKSLRYLHEPEKLWVALEELDNIAIERGLQQAAPTPEPESNIHNDQKKHEEVLDSGLQKLGKVEPKL